MHLLGAISAASTLGPPGKPPQLEDSYSPYNLMSSSESPTSPLVAPDSWGQGKSPNEKITNGTNINWPPGEETIHVHRLVRARSLDSFDLPCESFEW